MPDNLARFERLARQAAERRSVQKEAERKAEAERWEREWNSDAEQSRQSPEFLAGPPNNCHACYEWGRAKLGGWYWTHGVAIDPVRGEVTDYYGDALLDQEFCTHTCHGPEGLWLPVIALAAC